VQELTGGTPTANVLTGLSVDEYFTRTEGADSRNYLTDILGSTVALTDAIGAVQTEYTYDSFGATTTSGTSSGNRIAFSGRELDDTGLTYYRARYYDSRLQRFISEDPIGFAGGDVNLHVYVRNDPSNLIDPLGTIPMGRGWNSCSPASSKGGWSGFLREIACDPNNMMPSVGPLGMAASRAAGPARAAAGAAARRARSGARQALAKWTGRNPATHHAHHKGPVKFADFFESKGINIKDPKYMDWWESHSHLSKAAEFNREWAEWIREYGQTATREQVLEAMEQISKRFPHK
jgi:RHS repeat-associated protein